MTNIKYAVLLILGAALLVVGQGLSSRRAPSFSIPDSSFLQHDLLDYRGGWLIIEFMKTDCPHCRAVAATLEELKHRPEVDKRPAVLSIVVPPDNLTTVAKYLAETKTTSPVLFDSGQVAASYFNITPRNNAHFDVPHWFAIDPQGMIVRDWGQASADSKDWVKEFDQLAAKKK